MTINVRPTIVRSILLCNRNRNDNDNVLRRLINNRFFGCCFCCHPGNHCCIIVNKNININGGRTCSTTSTSSPASRFSQLIKEMPKDPTAARELKEQRIRKQQERAKLINAPSGKVSLHILGNGAPGNPSVLFVASDHHRYMFNCGEGSQRLAVTHAHRYSKLSHIFLTRTSWKQMGGLPGISMSLQCIGVPGITVHTPHSIVKLYEITRYFSVTAELSVQERLAKDSSYSDSNLTVTYVPIKRKEGAFSSLQDDGDKMIGDTVFNYIVKLAAVPGKLNIDKCFQLKVPKGPALGQLKNGQDYVFPDGRVVRSADVVDPEEPGPIFLVIDCPTKDYIDSMISNHQLERHISTSEESHIPSHVIHFSPVDVMEDTRYKEWMSRFPGSTLHFGINEGNNNNAFTSVSLLQSQLRLLDPVLFPEIYVDEKKRLPEGSYVPSETNHQMILRPRGDDAVRYDDTLVPGVDDGSAVNNLLESEGVPEAIRSYKEKILALEQQQNLVNQGKDPSIYPIINFLGTASAQPGKDRNTSFILIEIDSETSIIFDCGEGSYGQMFRFFGPTRIGEELRKIQCIFVSHLHADHHLGLISLLQKRAKFTDVPVTLILPQAVHNWLLAFDSMYQPLKHLFVCKQSENFMSRTPFDRDMLSGLKLSNLQTARVKHCRDSFGICITTRGTDDSGEASINNNIKPFKIVYSGDSMPTPFLSVVGKDCDVLIHEATMDDHLLDEAILKRHSTTSQAIDMGRSMNARYTILTHFSQRYAKVPMIDAAGSFEGNNVGCAFDNMRIRRCDLPRMVLLHEPLRLMFNDKQQEMMDRVTKRNLRRQVHHELLQQHLQNKQHH